MISEGVELGNSLADADVGIFDANVFLPFDTNKFSFIRFVLPLNIKQ